MRMSYVYYYALPVRLVLRLPERTPIRADPIGHLIQNGVPEFTDSNQFPAKLTPNQWVQGITEVSASLTNHCN